MHLDDNFMLLTAYLEMFHRSIAKLLVVWYINLLYNHLIETLVMSSLNHVCLLSSSSMDRTAEHNTLPSHID